MFESSHLFFFGDLNFRLALPSTHALAAPEQLPALSEALSHDEGRTSLKAYDQLMTERDVKGTVFQGFREGEFWRFKCSYKYRLGEVDQYDPKRMPAWTDRIMYVTHSDSPETPRESGIQNVLYTAIPAYTTSDHKPVVSVLLLPPSTPTTNAVPIIQLPAGYRPIPDRLALLKKYSGRMLDRVVGYTWWLLSLLGAGSTLLGLGNLFFSLGLWRWWSTRAEPDILLP